MSELAKELKAIQRANYRSKVEAIVAQHKGIAAEVVTPKPVAESIFKFEFESLENDKTDDTTTNSNRKRKKGKGKFTSEINQAGEIVAISNIEETNNAQNIHIPKVSVVPKHVNNTEINATKLSEVVHKQPMTTNKPDEKKVASGTGKKQVKSSTTSSKKSSKEVQKDDEMEFLNQTLKQLELENIAKQELLKKQALENKNKKNTKNNVIKGSTTVAVAPGASKIKFISASDPSLSSKMKLKVKYGDGK